MRVIASSPNSALLRLFQHHADFVEAEHVLFAAEAAQRLDRFALVYQALQFLFAEA